MDKISIIPVGGLCNRMRVVASSINIAKKIGAKKCNIYWNNNEDCAADFTDLFLPIHIANVSVTENDNIMYKQPTKKNFQIPRILLRLYYDQVIWGFNNKTDGDIMQIIKPSKKLLLYTCHSMYEHYPLSEIFTPRPDIESVIQRITSSFTTNTIGLHIRRTDHVVAIENSPLSYFYDLIEAEIKKNRDVVFYLATDDKDVKNDLKSRYANRIITFDCELSRTSKEGMKNAVVDLFALSRTVKIYGSLASSYSELAAEIGNIPLIIKKSSI